jgi:tryptophanyl-tRNA synthetase
MEEHQSRRVVVLNPAKRLIGIVSLSNVAAHTGKERVPTAMLTLYESLTNDERSSIEAELAGKGYNFRKNELIEVVLAAIQPVQARYAAIRHEPNYIDTLLRQGADRVRPLAGQTMEEVRRVIGVG